MSDLEVYRPRQVSIWQRFKESLRSLRIGGINLKDPALARYFGGEPAYSGVQVSADSALRDSTFFSGARLIGSNSGSLPLVLYRILENGGKERFTTHPLYRLVHDRPNPFMTSAQFREAFMISAVVYGNGFAEVERDGAGRPVALWPLMPWNVSPFWERNVLRYRVTNDSGTQIVLEARDMLHVAGPSLDGVMGFDTVRQAREALGLAMAAERYSAQFFGQGSQPGGVLTPGMALSPQARENLQQTVAARNSGLRNAHKWLLLEPGMTFTEANVNARDSQLSELRVHQVREIARFLGIPVSMLGDLERSTYANYEQEVLAFYTGCLRPWLVKIEQELNAKLIAPSEQRLQQFEHVVEGFLRADTEKRAAFYTAALAHGWMTVNEVRRLENLGPINGGDRPRVPMNTQFLDEGLETEPDTEVIEPQGRKAVVLAAHRDLLVDALGRLIRRQADRAKNAHATPQKLRHFVEVFYDDAFQQDAFRAVLRPALRAWLAYIGSEANVDDVVETVVRQHFEDSKMQLLRVADMEAGELFETALRNLLLRWDSDRAGQTADHILQHGLTKDGQLSPALLALPSSPALSPSVAATRGMSVAMKQKWLKTRLAMAK